ncbi:MAG: multiheme c-type cytochrome [Planctomycetota bacterium]
MRHQFNRILRQRARAGLGLLPIFLMLLANGLTQASDPESNADSETEDEFWGVQALMHGEAGSHRIGIRGAASCAASGCHGGPGAAVASTSAERGSEYPLFVENDPHSRSWRTLNSDTSIEILTKLGILRDGSIVQPEAYRNCLACHNTDRTLDQQTAPKFAEGVGCEACHGPSQSWYDAHYQGPDSVRKAKADLGLIDTKPLLQRARTCALCHVGAKDRDMNHDIIAAGHPALYFDMAVYHNAYPKHWREPEAESESFRAKLWWAGQIAKADAELELIQTRAGNNHHVSVWPEFAQYQCTSCHNTLDGLPAESTRTTTGDEVDWELLGRASVRRWNLQGIELLSRPTPNGDTNVSLGTDELLTKVFAALNAPSTPRQAIIPQAAELRESVVHTLTSQRSSDLERWNTESQRQQAIQRLQQTADTNDWEQAALTYLTVWTAVHPSAGPSRLNANMATIRNGLIFPCRTQSPIFPRSTAPGVRPTRQEWNNAIEQVLGSLRSIEP